MKGFNKNSYALPKYRGLTYTCRQGKKDLWHKMTTGKFTTTFHNKELWKLVICNDSKSSKLLFSYVQLIHSCHGDPSIKEQDFTEMIILSWHRCLNLIGLSLLFSFCVIWVDRTLSLMYSKFCILIQHLSPSTFFLSVWLYLREGSGFPLS